MRLGLALAAPVMAAAGVVLALWVAGIIPPSPSEPSVPELTESVVQIVAQDSDGSLVWAGCGTTISGDGLVLTAAHVVDDRQGEYETLQVGVVWEPDRPPEPRYIAEVTAVDYTLDLAVIRIVSDLDGIPAEVDLPYVSVGDSDVMEIGDHVRVLGFPEIGGQTVTLTEGSISGFTRERDISDRAWMKTDATIAAGHSGGLAVNDAGELIGVPAIAGSGAESGQVVDCRPVVDTNRDGVVDDEDDCVPVGGFINGLRPVNLAAPLIEAARTGSPYVSRFPQPQPEPAFDPEDVVLEDVEFADGVTEDDRPTEVITWLPSGSTDLCAFWDYEKMVDGVTWEALWFIDGELSEDGSFMNKAWAGGESGNYWICILDEGGVEDGLYELVLSVEGDYQASEAIFVGGDHPVVDVELMNASSDAACIVAFSPTGAQHWGPDELGPTETMSAGSTRTFSIRAGLYDVWVLSCEPDVLMERYDVDIAADTTLTVR